MSLVCLGILSACGGSSEPPPATELVWDEGAWDELNWQ